MQRRHQYIERDSRTVCTEQFFGDEAVRFLYSTLRERAPWLFGALIGARASRLLSLLSFGRAIPESMRGRMGLFSGRGIDLRECVNPPAALDTLEKLFTRKIRYWECRPMPNDPAAVVAPADSRMLLGSFHRCSSLFLKGKFFDYEELLGRDKKTWLRTFQDGDFGIFRLTPDKYHYVHTPVAGRVVDFYRISGLYHTCHPSGVVEVVTPYSKNKRIVTIIDTDVEGGTKVGLVAVVEVVALMIGDVVQCYSRHAYADESPIGTGMFLEKGKPKSLFRPGSSTVLLFFQKGRARFADDLVANRVRAGVDSILSSGFGSPLVETDVQVRSYIATACSCLSSALPAEEERTLVRERGERFPGNILSLQETASPGAA